MPHDTPAATTLPGHTLRLRRLLEGSQTWGVSPPHPPQAPSLVPARMWVSSKCSLSPAWTLTPDSWLCSGHSLQPLHPALQCSDFEPVICFLEAGRNSHVQMKGGNAVNKPQLEVSDCSQQIW